MGEATVTSRSNYSVAPRAGAVILPRISEPKQIESLFYPLYSRFQKSEPYSLLSISPRRNHLVNDQSFMSAVVSRSHQRSILNLTDVVFCQGIPATVVFTILKQEKVRNDNLNSRLSQAVVT